MRSLFIIASFMYFQLAITGCTSSGSSYSRAESAAHANPTAAQASIAEQGGRALIWNASVLLEVSEMGDSIKKVGELAAAAGGYVEQSSVSDEGSSAFLSIRVESRKLVETLDHLASLGTELSREVSSEDVSEKLVDSSAKLENSLKLRDRLRSLLDKATKIEDALSIEKELARLQADIDVLEGQIKKLKGNVSLALIHVKLQKYEILGPLGYIFKGTFWLLGKLFFIN